MAYTPRKDWVRILREHLLAQHPDCALVRYEVRCLHTGRVLQQGTEPETVVAMWQANRVEADEVEITIIERILH
jgi:hypothetical protein